LKTVQHGGRSNRLPRPLRKKSRKLTEIQNARSEKKGGGTTGDRRRRKKDSPGSPGGKKKSKSASLFLNARRKDNKGDSITYKLQTSRGKGGGDPFPKRYPEVTKKEKPRGTWEILNVPGKQYSLKGIDRPYKDFKKKLREKKRRMGGGVQGGVFKKVHSREGSAKEERVRGGGRGRGKEGRMKKAEVRKEGDSRRTGKDR